MKFYSLFAVFILLIVSCVPQQTQNRNPISYKATKQQIITTLIEVASDVRPLFTFPGFTLQSQIGDLLQFQSGGSVFVNFTVVGTLPDITSVTARGSAPATGIFSVNIDAVVADFFSALDKKFKRL
jgi:hypothetical protein